MRRIGRPPAVDGPFTDEAAKQHPAEDVSNSRSGRQAARLLRSHPCNPHDRPLCLARKVFLAGKVTLFGRFVVLRVLRFFGPPSTNLPNRVIRKVSHGSASGDNARGNEACLLKKLPEKIITPM